MAVKLYEFVEGTPQVLSATDRVHNVFRSAAKTGGSIPAVVATPVIAVPLVAAVILEAPLLATIGVVGGAAYGASLLVRPRDQVERLPTSLLHTFRSGEVTEPLSLGNIYATHPHDSKVLIRASALQATVVQEQVHEVLAYAMSKMSLTKFVAQAKSRKSGKAAAISSNIPLSAEARIELSKDYKLVIEFTEPSDIMPYFGPQGWIERFPSIKRALDSGVPSRIVQTESTDLSFGMGAKLAEQIGIDVDWISRFDWSFEIETARR